MGERDFSGTTGKMIGESIGESIEGINAKAEAYSIYDLERSDVMTGDSNKNRYLYYQLKQSILNAKSIDIVVSFLMESGVKMLLKDLKMALDRGVQIRLLTGNYLGITQPSALYLLKNELGDRIDLRFYNQKNRSFHPKAYMFHRENESEIYIGSSNISRSALTSGIEWNYRFSKSSDTVNFGLFMETFVDLFDNHSIIIDDNELKRYSKEWKRPAVQRDLDKYDENEEDVSHFSVENTSNIKDFFKPRGVQIEALYSLNASREEGADRGLIYAATGIGKTYLAAFDSEKFNRILFVAHREEILSQAAETFCNVRKSQDYGFFNSKNKDTQNSIIFASVNSLGKDRYLNEQYFASDYFDYIVIDEFHHAVNDQYKKIMDYFKPKYILGLTATPVRMDGRNIYELCDYIVPYQITLKEAINKGVLVPFHYYGIFDDTVDYGEIHLVKGEYVKSELNEKFQNEARYDLIYKHYLKYRSKQALGFCCSRVHAEKMAMEFCSRGIPSVAVYSNSEGEFSEDRKTAIKKLRTGEIKVIFSVDMFNEGLDISSVDMVMFLRPTESPVVFLQQLGRGLRSDRSKDYLNVLDFIGNYQKAGSAPFLLSGQSYSREDAAHKNQYEFEFPDDCVVDFDMRLIDLFKEMAKHQMKAKELFKEEYFRVKELLDNKVPSRMELFNNMNEEVYLLCMKRSAENPFKHYLEYLYELKELSLEEEHLYQGIGKEFLSMLEVTSMSKSYKMPILLAFYNKGNVKMEIDEDDVVNSYQDFYNQGVNWKDLMTHNSSKDFKNWDKKRYLSEAKKNPVNYLKKSGNGFFVDKEGYVLALNDQLSEVVKLPAFERHMKDIIDYRVMNYYRTRFDDEG